MRAPPEAETTISGVAPRDGAVDGAGDLLAHHRAHAAADEFRLHDADLHRAAGQPACGGDQRVGEAGGRLAWRSSRSLYGLAVHETRAGRRSAGRRRTCSILAVVQQQLQRA